MTFFRTILLPLICTVLLHARWPGALAVETYDVLIRLVLSDGQLTGLVPGKFVARSKRSGEATSQQRQDD